MKSIITCLLCWSVTVASGAVVGAQPPRHRLREPGRININLIDRTRIIRTDSHVGDLDIIDIRKAYDSPDMDNIFLRPHASFVPREITVESGEVVINDNVITIRGGKVKIEFKERGPSYQLQFGFDDWVDSDLLTLEKNAYDAELAPWYYQLPSHSSDQLKSKWQIPSHE